MNGPDLESKLATLFEETGEAHHEAFIETGGQDANWSLWYADFSLVRLNELLHANLTKEELVKLLVTAEDERSSSAPEAAWPEYYGKFFADALAS